MSRTEKILVVDDEADILNLLSEVLSGEFSNTEFARNGEEACKKLEENQYDLVLTDIVMPGVDGIEVLKKAKELYDDIIVLMMTGKASLNSAIDSIHLGADEYITKPFNIAHLLNVIKSYLERQRLSRENIRLQRQVERDRDQLKKNLVELSTLYNFSRNLAYNFDVSEVYNSILESLSEAVSNDFCSIYEIKRKTISIKTSVKLSPEVLKWLKNTLITFVESECDAIIDKKGIHCDIRETGKAASPGEAVNAFFNIVLTVNDETFGVLNVSRFVPKDFSEDDKRFLVKLADQSSAIFTQLQTVVESQKNKMQRLIEDLPDGIIMHDQWDDSILINPAAKNMIADAGVADFDKNRIERLFNFRFQDYYNDRGKLDKSFIHEIKIPFQDNKMFVLDAHVASLSGPDGMPQGILMVLRDVTKEREVERLKSEFISNVSHELRTPAAILKEFTSIMRDGIAGPTTDTQNEYLLIMASNIERLSRLIDNLLSISSMEAGILRLYKVKFDLKSIVKNVVRTLNIRYAKKQMVIKKEIQEDLPQINADPDAITQILINCLDNSRKFSPEGSEVILRVKVEGTHLHLEVQDSGMGIPKQEIDKIFDRFYRIEDKDRVHQEGSGLGLAIVKKFVDLHGGTVTVESELNKGSTFHITIPIQTVEEFSEVTG